MSFGLTFQNKVQSKKVRVNDIDIQPEEFISMSLNVSLFEDKQYCTIVLKELRDNFHTINQGSKLEFYIKDRIGNEYLEEEFMVVGINKTVASDTSTPNIYHIEFIDRIHFDMVNTYESNFYKDTLGSDIILENLEKYGNGTTKWNITPTEYIYPQFLSPQNINQMKVIRKIAVDNGLFFYRGFEHYSLKTYEEMVKDVLPEEVRVTLTEGEASHKIVELQATVYNAFDMMRTAPASNLYTMDALDKKVTKELLSHPDLVEEVKVNAFNNYLPLTIETKEATRSGMTTLKRNRLKLHNQKEIINNTSLTVIVDGDMRIEPGKVIDVLITHKRNPNEDLTLSGTYLVISASNNYVGNHYYQEIVISRV